MLDAPLAIVDLETTGAHPAHDRVTEIAVIEVEGGEVRDEWSTLVNPETPIPAAIQALTGITNDMVAGAPTFGRLAGDLHERLQGRVFVAHNARFDYGFLKREFARAGLDFRAKTLCTVRLSRRLYPEHARHNLDSLIARHGLQCRARHRALGDADAVWQFLRLAAEERGAEVMAVAARQVAKQPSLPPHLDPAMVDEIPEAPGVYLFYGEGGTPLYVGKSKHMRSRVLAHFAGDLRSGREMQLAREVRRIEWQRTAGELGALLREAALVKELLPVFNRQLRRATELCGFAFDGLRLRLARDFGAEGLEHVHGLFRSKRAALEALRGLADAHGLCLQSLGFERARKGACFRHQIGRCAGLCAAKESPAAHHARLAAALAGMKTAAWPWRGPVGVLEEDREREASELHVVHQWCYLGTARSEDEVAALLEAARRPRFDLDQYKLLVRHLLGRRARIVELACTAS
ncbi:MAG: exonuclease domain-containing protein [Betaproteobacteria bacterium]|nr:exonuclease domain-containing protein [Betaproteobacteria bacterium]MDH5221263.1 exonuclease domain-containing protein [Betaproteobacteria bacterium]MDH5349486.1 exonuclease domain-containing protein [Betaproteobacteria bacterium]